MSTRSRRRLAQGRNIGHPIPARPPRGRRGDRGRVSDRLDACALAPAAEAREVENYGLRKHSATVGWVEHFAPSAAPPPGQNTDTRVSLASQLAAPSAWTDLKPAGAASPLSPLSPLSPFSPLGPGAPWGPCGPCAP